MNEKEKRLRKRIETEKERVSHRKGGEKNKRGKERQTEIQTDNMCYRDKRSAYVRERESEIGRKERKTEEKTEKRREREKHVLKRG